MKLTKLSLVAALLVGSSAFAIENTKVSGDVKLFYGTTDTDSGTYAAPGGNGFFDAAGSYGNWAVDLELTTDLSKGVSAGAKATYISTLGLENNLVDNTWSNAHKVTANNAASFAGGNQLDDSFYLGEMWIAGTAFDTTLKVGRQSLDTPLAFTETWGIDANTFEAAVAINQSLPNTTLVAAYVGKSNGSADDINSTGGNTNIGLNAISGASQAGYLSQDGKFNTFGSDGVYVFGAINNSFEPLTVQAWYYDLSQMAEAVWVQADLNMGGILLGAQFTEVDASTLIDGADSDEAFAVMAGYEMKDVATFKVAYSSVDDKGSIGVANVATGGAGATARNNGGAQSKLYTEMWWAYGNVSQVGSDSYSLTAETTISGVDLFAGLYFSETNSDRVAAAPAAASEEMAEAVLTASKSYGPLDTTVALIWDDYEDMTDATQNAETTTLQIYLTYNF